MTTFNFSDHASTTISFNSSTDILNFANSATSYRFTQASATSLYIEAISAGIATSYVTLSGTSLKQLTSSNFVFADGSSLLVGDANTATTNDDLAQLTGESLDLVTANGSSLDENHVIYGMGGDDIITTGNGDNTIYGGAGTADSTDGSDNITINGGGASSGNNTIYSNAGNDTIIFTDPTATGKTATIHTGSGNDDVITGAAAGTISVIGGSGNDTVDASSSTGSLYVYGGAGTSDTTDGADVITSGLGSTYIFANAGNDSIFFDDFGSSVTQSLYAGLGDDTINGDPAGTGSSGNLVLAGGLGSDYIDITTHLGNSSIFGGSSSADSADGADTIFVGTGNANAHALIYANAGADTITSSAALAAGESLTIYGGAAVDEFNISGARSATSTLLIYAGAANDAINIDDSALAANATTQLAGFESTDILSITLSGGSATDLVVTGLGASLNVANDATGHGEYDFISYTGNLTASNFVISDGSVLLTNNGLTAASLSGTTNADQIIAGDGGDTISGAGGNDLITGGGGADSITGGTGVCTINGAAGNDTIVGGTTGSSIDGGESSDSITGGIGNDTIIGGTGGDTINGGGGADSVTGGLGVDVFAFNIAKIDDVDTNVLHITDAFSGFDVFSFADLTSASLRGAGTGFALGNGTSGQTLGADIGLYVATNTTADFTEANIYTALSGIADDVAASDIFYILISNGTDARLARITETANAGSLAAADDALTFVARLDGVTNSELAALTHDNFSNFS